MNWTNFTIGLSVVTIVVMGFIVLSPAHASSGCADKHENVSRINPTELSDYQKCVFDYYGKTSGVHGNFLWFSLNGEFYHIQKDDIIDTTPDGIQRLIVKTILEDDVAAKLEEAQTMLELASMNERKYAEEIRELKERIGNLQEITEGLATDAYQLTQISHFGGKLRIHFQSHIDGSIADHFYETRVSYTNITPDVFRKIKNAMNEVVRAAYEQGYEDGYKAGYKDGYNQAVSDLNK